MEQRLLGGSGPFWLRRLAKAGEAEACPELREALRLAGARRMVVGHTQVTHGQVQPRCGGQLLMADTIISKSGHPECWQEGSMSIEGCEGSKSYVEIRGNIAYAVRLLDNGSKDEELLPLSGTSASTPQGEL